MDQLHRDIETFRRAVDQLLESANEERRRLLASYAGSVVGAKVKELDELIAAIDVASTKAGICR